MPELEHASPFTSLFIVLILAAIVPVIVSRFKKLTVPIVVGEIIAGIILGRSGFKLAVSDQPILEFLAEFGLVFLMFLSGMEIDLSNLGASNLAKREKIQPFEEPGDVEHPLFHHHTGHRRWDRLVLYAMELVKDPIMMGLILSTTSLGVVVPVLKEQGLIGGKYGQTLLMAALVADFVTMLLITVEVAILSSGLTMDVLLIMLLFAAFLAFYRLGNIFFNRIKAVRRVIEELSHATAQIKFRIAIAIMLFFVVIAETLGAEVILGAFLAGVIVTLLGRQEDETVIHQLEAIGYGFIIPIFFIMVGVDINFSALFSSSTAMLLVPLLLAAAFVVKLVGAAVFRFAFSTRQTLAGGLLLSSRLSLIIAAVAIGSRLGVISDAVNAATIVVAVITVTVSPLIFSRLMPRKEQTGQRYIMIVGAGELGRRVAEQLQAHHEQFIIVTNAADRYQRTQEMGYEAVLSRFEDLDETVSAYLEKTDNLVVTHTNIERNYRICELAKSVGIRAVVSHVSDPNEVERFKNMGVRTLNSALDRAPILALSLATHRHMIY